MVRNVLMLMMIALLYACGPADRKILQVIEVSGNETTYYVTSRTITKDGACIEFEGYQNIRTESSHGSYRLCGTYSIRKAKEMDL